MRRRRRFYRGSLNHIYQRTVNGFNIFYSDEDYLVFYTINTETETVNISRIMFGGQEISHQLDEMTE